MPPPPAELFATRVFLGPALRAQPDRRLVNLVRNGYDAAFEEIVRRYRRPLDRFAAAIVGGRSEDVTQDAFSKALPALRGSEAEIELRPWLYRIVRNTALNELRDRAPAAAELSEALPGARSTAAEVEAREGAAMTTQPRTTAAPARDQTTASTTAAAPPATTAIRAPAPGAVTTEAAPAPVTATTPSPKLRRRQNRRSRRTTPAPAATGRAPMMTP
jgi:RNA polymerase sigma factor (sigma-70 family)